MPRSNLLARCAALDTALTTLVQTAPKLADADVQACAGGALAIAASVVTTLPGCAALALAIERTVDGVADGNISQSIALPSMAMAAYTLAQSIAAEEPRSTAAISAARYELETMLPMADRQAKNAADVPLAKLSPRLAAQPTAAERARTARLAALVGEFTEEEIAAVTEARARYA